MTFSGVSSWQTYARRFKGSDCKMKFAGVRFLVPTGMDSAGMVIFRLVNNSGAAEQLAERNDVCWG